VTGAANPDATEALLDAAMGGVTSKTTSEIIKQCVGTVPGQQRSRG
jgi:hypothetical protein